MPHEHERALGGWQVEWVTIPAIFEAAAGSLSAVADMCEGLEVNSERMKNNLDHLNGLFMSERVMVELSKKIGKPKAKKIIDEACDKASLQNMHLAEILRADSRFTEEISLEKLDKLMLMDEYLGTSSVK